MTLLVFLLFVFCWIIQKTASAKIRTLGMQKSTHKAQQFPFVFLCQCLQRRETKKKRVSCWMVILALRYPWLHDGASFGDKPFKWQGSHMVSHSSTFPQSFLRAKMISETVFLSNTCGHHQIQTRRVWKPNGCWLLLLTGRPDLSGHQQWWMWHSC